MTLYRRPGGAAPVGWEPDDVGLGKEAITEIVGEPDSWPAEVSNEEAEEIREMYEKLTAEGDAAEGVSDP